MTNRLVKSHPVRKCHPVFSMRAIRFATALSVLGASALHAEDSGAGKTSWETTFSSSVIGGTNFKSGFRNGNVDLWDIGGGAVLSWKMNNGQLIRFGGDFHRYNFNSPVNLPLPSQLQSFNLVLGADFQIGEALLARLEIQPGFYSGSGSLRSDDLNVPLQLGGFYFWSTDVQLVLGLRMDVQSEYPVLPGAGIRWRINDSWVLNAIVPAPRIEYSVTKAIMLYAGARLDGGSYRMPADFGSRYGNPRLNNGWVNHTLIRVGGGVSWSISPAVTFELEAGCVPVNRIEIPRADFTVRSSASPAYGGISLKAQF